MSPYIDAHLTHLAAAGRADRTICDRRDVLRRVDVALPFGLLRGVTRELELWLAHPGGRWSDWTLRTYHMHLRGFYRWAAAGREPLIRFDPMAAVPRPRSPRGIPNPVSDAELARALAGSGPQWQLIILLGAYAGLRASEIARLSRDDVDARRLVVVGKGGTVATVPTHPLVWEAIAPMPAGPLIRRHDGSPATGRWLSIRARRHFDRLDLPRVHLHRFRHWFGTTTQRINRDLRVTQELMRHASPATTAGYALVADEQLAAAVGALPSVQAAGRSS